MVEFVLLELERLACAHVRGVLALCSILVHRGGSEGQVRRVSASHVSLGYAKHCLARRDNSLPVKLSLTEQEP